MKGSVSPAFAYQWSEMDMTTTGSDAFANQYIRARLESKRSPQHEKISKPQEISE